MPEPAEKPSLHSEDRTCIKETSMQTSWGNRYWEYKVQLAAIDCLNFGSTALDQLYIRNV